MNEQKKSGRSVIISVAVAAAFVLLAVFVVYVVTPRRAEVPAASRPEFSVPDESSEPEISLPPAEFKTHMSEAEVGNLVYYGRYAEQQGDPEPIEWIVLDKQDDKLLLITRDCLLRAPFNEERGGAGSFSESTLKTYLNSEFISEAFTEKESDNLIGSDGEKLFILSSDEALKYFEPDSHRIAKAAASCEGGGIKAGDRVMWWLSDVNPDGFVKYVFTDGTVRDKGFAGDYTGVCVRIAVWVSAEAEAQ